MGATAELLRAQREAAEATKKANADRLEAAKISTAEANAAAAKARAEKANAPVPWTAKSAGNLNPATPGGAGSAAGLVCIAGAIAFFGNMKLDKGFPKAGVRIVSATILLAIIFSLFDRSRVSPIARGAAGLMVLAAVIKYVPVLSNSKGKKNG